MGDAARPRPSKPSVARERNGYMMEPPMGFVVISVLVRLRTARQIYKLTRGIGKLSDERYAAGLVPGWRAGAVFFHARNICYDG